MLAEPRLRLVMLISAVCGIPGAAYLSGCTSWSQQGLDREPGRRRRPVRPQFLLIIIPFAFLLLQPEATKAMLEKPMTGC